MVSNEDLSKPSQHSPCLHLIIQAVVGLGKHRGPFNLFRFHAVRDRPAGPVGSRGCLATQSVGACPRRCSRANAQPAVSTLEVTASVRVQT